jgi:hypothetical protein
MIAAMDEDGFCSFASPHNVARRAVVEIVEAETALATLEAPDPHSSDPENDGRRLERVPGGWIVLNASKYREIVTRAESKRLNRERQKRHYDRKKNAVLTTPNVHLTQSEAYTNTETQDQEHALRAKSLFPVIKKRLDSDLRANPSLEFGELAETVKSMAAKERVNLHPQDVTALINQVLQTLERRARA